MSVLSCGVWQWHKKNLKGGPFRPPARNSVKEPFVQRPYCYNAPRLILWAEISVWVSNAPTQGTSTIHGDELSEISHPAKTGLSSVADTR